MHSLGKTLLASTLHHFVLQGLTCLLFQVFLDFLLLYFSPLDEKNILFFFFGVGASLVAQLVKNPPATWETWVQSLSWKDSLEKRKGSYFSVLAWIIP